MIAYFDTSALVKLLTEEAGSEVARRLWNAADVVFTSRITYPEGRAALAAARRAGRLSDESHSEAKRLIRRRLEVTRVVDLSEEIAQDAGDLAEAHRLRGFDAVHLASAIAPGDREVVVATWDLELSRAAGELGLAVAGESSA